MKTMKTGFAQICFLKTIFPDCRLRFTSLRTTEVFYIKKGNRFLTAECEQFSWEMNFLVCGPPPPPPAAFLQIFFLCFWQMQI